MAQQLSSTHMKLIRSLLVIILAHSNVCASASVICRHGTNCECSVDEPCHLECIGDYQCTGGNTLTCQPSQPCVLRCEGEQACANSTLIPNGASSVSVECIGENACDDTEIVRESNDSRSLTINSGCVLSQTSSDTTVMPSVNPILVPTAVPTVIPTVPTMMQLFVPTTYPTPSPTATHTPTTTTSPTASPGYNDAEGQDLIADFHEHVQRNPDSEIKAIVIVCLAPLCICMLVICVCVKSKARASKRRQSNLEAAVRPSIDNQPVNLANRESGSSELAVMSQNPICGPASEPPRGPPVDRPHSIFVNEEDVDCLFDDEHKTQDEHSAEGAQYTNAPAPHAQGADDNELLVQHKGSAASSVDEQHAQVVTGRSGQDGARQDTTESGAV